MSRKIDITKPLSDEDRKWLEGRDRQDLLRLNARYVEGADTSASSDPEDESQTGDTGEDKDTGEDGDTNSALTALNVMTVDELQAELKKVNLPASGKNKEELVNRLLEADWEPATTE